MGGENDFAGLSASSFLAVVKSCLDKAVLVVCEAQINAQKNIEIWKRAVRR